MNAADRSVVDGLLEEADCFNRAVATPAARSRMARFLEPGGGQGRDVELDPRGFLARIMDTA